MDKFTMARVFNYRMSQNLNEQDWLSVLVLEEALKEKKILSPEQDGLLQSILARSYSDADRRIWKILQEREEEACWERSQRDWK